MTVASPCWVPFLVFMDRLVSLRQQAPLSEESSGTSRSDDETLLSLLASAQGQYDSIISYAQCQGSLHRLVLSVFTLPNLGQVRCGPASD